LIQSRSDDVTKATMRKSQTEVKQRSLAAARSRTFDAVESRRRFGSAAGLFAAELGVMEVGVLRTNRICLDLKA